MEVENLKSKIKEFVAYFRQKEMEMGKIAESKFFFEPCQITVVRFYHETPEHESQLFVFTHWDDTEDLNVEIHGLINFTEFIGFSNSFIKEEKWSRSVNIDDYPDLLILNINKPFFDEKYQFSKIIELILFRTYTILSAKHISEYKDHRYNYWISKNKFQDKNIDSEIETLFKVKTERKTEVSEDSDIFKGVYTYFYPPLWIGPPPEISFKDRMNDVSLSKYIKGYKTSFKESDLILKSNSYIALELKDGEIPTEEVNLIMALIFLSGKDVRSISRWDLMSITFKKSTGQPLMVKFFEITERSRLHYESLEDPISSIFSKDWLSIEVNKIKEIIKKAEALHDNKEISKSLIFLIESYTHLSRNRYSQSFIMNWITIERYINILWQRFIEEKGYTSKRKDYLKNDVRTWTVSSRLEVLNIIGLLNDNDYQVINKFRKARNDFAHDREVITEELSKECLAFTKKLVLQFIKNFNSSFLPL